MSNSTSECNSYATAAVPRCTDRIILAALAGLGPEGELISWWEAAGAPARANYPQHQYRRAGAVRVRGRRLFAPFRERDRLLMAGFAYGQPLHLPYSRGSRGSLPGESPHAAGVHTRSSLLPHARAA
jgi:hypothetical protein